ncbi:keratin, type II cytoskeletal 8-like [Clarias gariepinus]|uniref:keratin, type II cytoskeletal 8-like n=1 Tax=Clarias gariepinus TaxID=13013 RepID=UPI00234CF67E|nr:keratin, type II cytoskeletal 8-like [Clarias gariepinus]
MSSRMQLSTKRNVSNFSSCSVGSYGPNRTIPRTGNTYFGFGNQYAMGSSINSVVVDERLLEPLQLDLDPNIYAIREKEKNQIKTLNDRFAIFINKVQQLEKRNTVAETKLQLLQNEPQKESNIEALFKMYISSLQAQLNTLENSHHFLKADLERTQSMVTDQKSKYEEEVNKRYAAENDFVCIKRDFDSAYLSRANLEVELSLLQQELNFHKSLYEEELQELQEQLQETLVVVEIDNCRQLDMEQVVKEVKRQYEDVSARSRHEVEAWYKRKFELASSQVELQAAETKRAKSEIDELKRRIVRLRADLSSAKMEFNNKKEQVKEAERSGQEAVLKAEQEIKKLEAALQKNKQKMARQVFDYNNLMNVKLALDIEIATYRKLLEGEENRIGLDSVVYVQTVPTTTHVDSVKSVTCASLIVKTTETQESSFIGVQD